MITIAATRLAYQRMRHYSNMRDADNEWYWSILGCSCIGSPYGGTLYWSSIEYLYNSGVKYG